MKDCVILSSREIHRALADRLASQTGRKFHFIHRPADLTPAALSAISPEYIFVPHWSHLIPEAIYAPFQVVIFHMTDLPYGRGGSPLQNLVVRGHESTKISAIRCSAGLDDGPVYLKAPLSLEGTAEEILQRAAAVIEKMILEILSRNPQPLPQTGEPVVFRRRRPEESALPELSDLNKIYDFIRMLDAPGYPHAFLRVGDWKVEFTKALAADGRLTAQATFTPWKDHGAK